jgi:hypothetical protein
MKLSSTASSGACPSFFRGLVAQGRRDRNGYFLAGRELARHARSKAEGDVPDDVIDEFDKICNQPVDQAAQELVDWMRRVLPRCMRLVPRRRQNTTFLRGVATALQEGIVHYKYDLPPTGTL